MGEYHCFSKKVTKAVKRHDCIWCGEHIDQGDEYLREKSVADGHHQNFAWHPECNKDAQEVFASGETEFMAHSAERPVKEPTP